MAHLLVPKSLRLLQSRMKRDPEGYEAKMRSTYRRFEYTLRRFRQQSALSLSSDPQLSKNLGDLSLFLAHMTPFYRLRLAKFPDQVSELLRTDARALPSSVRCQLAQSFILLVNREIVELEGSLELFMDLQVIGDRKLKKLAFSHVVHSIRHMNKKHRNEPKNKKLKNILFKKLQEDEELLARRSLAVLCDLHRRKVWFDAHTADAICNACLHSSSRVMVAALSFLLGFENNEGDADDSDASSSDDDETSQSPQVVLSREDVYKAMRKGTKRKKKAKLRKIIRIMKKQRRLLLEKRGSNSYSPLTHLKKAKGFAEKLFHRLRTCNEKFEVKMMMLKVIARTIGLHCLILSKFYPFLERYVQHHQRDVTDLLAAAIQACHDEVPPEDVESLFRQIVNQFVLNRSRPEAITVGLNAVREMCLRMPLLMNEDLIQELALYKKSHEKTVSIAARSLFTLFKEICPSLLVKKDRGLSIDPKARPKAFGEVSVASDVPGKEFLQHEDDPSTSSSEHYMDEDDAVDEEAAFAEDNGEEGNAGDENDDLDVGVELDESDEGSESEDLADEEIDEELKAQQISADEQDEGTDRYSGDDGEERDFEKVEDEPRKKKGKLVDEPRKKKGKLEDEPRKEKVKLEDLSLRALRRLYRMKLANASNDGVVEFLSDEDCQRIKDPKARRDAKQASSQHGLLRKDSNSASATSRIPSSELPSTESFDPAKLEAHTGSKLSKGERLAMVRAGREDRRQYQARAAVKQKKAIKLPNMSDSGRP